MSQNEQFIAVLKDLGYFDCSAEAAFNSCTTFASDVWRRLQYLGVEDAQLVKVVGLLRRLPKRAHAKWSAMKRPYLTHYVVRVDNTVIDPSAAQFGFPLIYPWKRLLKDWNEVYEMNADWGVETTYK